MNIIESDEETEIFTESTCKCDLCKDKEKIDKEWSKFKPKTNLQKRMKNVVEKISLRESPNQRQLTE